MHTLGKLAQVAVVAALAGAAHGQEYHQYHPQQGTTEIDFSGTLNFDPVDTQSFSGRYGYFVSRNLQLGVDASFTRVENGDSERFWDIGAFANWHFPFSAPFIPYAGIFAGFVDGTDVDSSNSYGVQGGVKYFFNPNVAAFGELRWRDLEDNDNQLGAFFGLSIFFR